MLLDYYDFFSYLLLPAHVHVSILRHIPHVTCITVIHQTEAVSQFIMSQWDSLYAETISGIRDQLIALSRSGKSPGKLSDACRDLACYIASVGLNFSVKLKHDRPSKQLHKNRRRCVGITAIVHMPRYKPSVFEKKTTDFDFADMTMDDIGQSHIWADFRLTKFNPCVFTCRPRTILRYQISPRSDLKRRSHRLFWKK